MLTNNFYHLQSAHAISTSISGKVVNTSGSVVNANAYNTEYYFTNLLAVGYDVVFSHDAIGVVVGRGNTPASKADYCLENIITSGLKQQKTTYATKFLDGGAEVVKVFILENTSDADITISEIGTVGRTFTDRNTSSVARVMVDRTVLDTPVTIPAGEMKTISYSIRLNYPA